MSLVAQYRQKANLGQIDFDPEQAAAAEILSLLLNRLKDWKPGQAKFLFGKPEPAPKGIYLSGKVGRGKSMLMDLFFEHAPTPKKWRVHFHEFMAFVHAQIDDWRKMSSASRRQSPFFVRGAGDDPIAPVAKQIAAKGWLICFDEFQVTDIADAMILGRLFDNLWARQCVIVMTANRPPREQYKDGINRELFLPFIAKLEEELDIHSLESARDYRLHRLESDPVYFYPLGKDADEFINRTWSRLTFGAKGAAQTMLVDNREVKINCTAAGCARFSFDELCANKGVSQSPMGAHDYLEIAKMFNIVFIENIPQLTEANSNEAARFRNLIDAIYEAKTKLIITAECATDELYLKGIQSFEFERTVSRLMEMRSKDYLALPHIS